MIPCMWFNHFFWCFPDSVVFWQFGYIMCPNVGLFVFFSVHLNVHSASWMFLLMYFIFGHYLFTVSLPLSFSSLYGTPTMHTLVCFLMSHRSLMLLFLSFSLLLFLRLNNFSYPVLKFAILSVWFCLWIPLVNFPFQLFFSPWNIFLVSFQVFFCYWYFHFVYTSFSWFPAYLPLDL